MADLGMSFSPFNQDASGKAQAGQTAGAAPVQDAIKILSLRTPTVVGASAAAPQALLGGPTVQGGSVGTAGSADALQALLRRLLMAQAASAAPGGQPPSSPFALTPGMAAPLAPSAAPSAPPTDPPLPVSFNFGTGNQPQPGSQPTAPPSQPSSPFSPSPIPGVAPRGGDNAFAPGSQAPS